MKVNPIKEIVAGIQYYNMYIHILKQIRISKN